MILRTACLLFMLVSMLALLAIETIGRLRGSFRLNANRKRTVPLDHETSVPVSTVPR